MKGGEPSLREPGVSSGLLILGAALDLTSLVVFKIA
jgi:hypothetical protein